jgi:hypothetical protein
MSTETIGLTKKQRDNVEQFLHLFADVESALKKRLGRRANDRTGTSILINSYAAKNPYWEGAANRLRNLAYIRNLLTHQRGTAFGYPIAVSLFSLQALREINEHLLNPEPVSDRYRKEVITVSDEDSLESVLVMAFEKGFSQFPVLSDQRFGGLITENEITRWLGHRAKANSVEVNLAAVTVKMVLKEKTHFCGKFRFFILRSLTLLWKLEGKARSPVGPRQVLDLAMQDSIKGID